MIDDLHRSPSVSRKPMKGDPVVTLGIEAYEVDTSEGTTS